MLRVTRIVMMGALSASLVFGCGEKKQVQRQDPATSQTDLSGNWNDTDARLTSEALIKQCFEAPWFKKFAQSEGRPPKIRVRNIVNKTDEHIDAQIFVKNIERAMVNGGDVEVVAQRGAETDAMRDEQDEGASGRVSDESAASIGNEEGADFVLVGRMASIIDQVEGQKAKLYKVTFELIGASSGKKAWIGDHEIKKVITQDSSSF